MCFVSSYFIGSRAMLISPVLSENRVVEPGSETPKSASSHLSQVILAVTDAIALNSASALERDTTVCFLVLQAMRKEPRKTQ
uniref:Uncharacterized protein n=1 Tax=Arundo donax TaxID=35708 RepID=A0A0A9GPS8_ARUDO